MEIEQLTIEFEEAIRQEPFPVSPYVAVDRLRVAAARAMHTHPAKIVVEAAEDAWELFQDLKVSSPGWRDIDNAERDSRLFWMVRADLLEMAGLSQEGESR